ncbi:MAG: single-stranded DNA-binding protein [Candidatus Pacebacteria bacterium]|nr:single-stranded DNA-binding protein [Candidatus Paceibacterota bacterium]
MQMNTVNLIGRITKDPELKYSTSGTAYCQFTLAINRRVAKDAEKVADFIPVTAWKGTAEYIANYGSKGRLMAVEGSLRTRSYEKDGKKVFVMEVLARSINFLDKANNSAADAPPPEDMAEEIPF